MSPNNDSPQLHQAYRTTIGTAVKNNLTGSGGIYTDDIIRESGLSRVCVTDWLKANGYEEPGSANTRYWRPRE